MTARICPNCGHAYTTPPDDGMCTTCTGVPLVAKPGTAGNVDAVATAEVYERGRLMTVVWIMAPLIVGGLIDWIFTIYGGRAPGLFFFGCLLAVVLPIAATYVRERRHGMWERRGLLSRLAIHAVFGLVLFGLVIAAAVISSGPRSPKADDTIQARRAWTVRIAKAEAGLTACFPDSGGRNVLLELTWNADGFSLGELSSKLDAAERGCVNGRVRQWPRYGFDPDQRWRCVSCIVPIGVQDGKRGCTWSSRPADCR